MKIYDTKPKLWIMVGMFFCLMIGMGMLLEDLLQFVLDFGTEYFKGCPWLILMGFVILPLVFVPVSPLYVFAAMVFGVPKAIAYVGISVSLNMIFAFLLTRTFLKRRILRYLEGKGFLSKRGETVRRGAMDYCLLTIGLRLTFGLPFSVQNYALALTDMKFFCYFIPSIPIVIFWAALFIGFSGLIFASKIGIGAIVFMAVIASLMVVKFVFKKKHASSGL